MKYISTRDKSKNFEFKDEIYLGIRPEDISLENNHEIQVDVKIDHVENLGFEKIVYSKVSENQIIIKSSENINNHSLKISFSKDKVLFFDKDVEDAGYNLNKCKVNHKIIKYYGWNLKTARYYSNTSSS